jgi:hypothetical protein
MMEKDLCKMPFTELISRYRASVEAEASSGEADLRKITEMPEQEEKLG